MPKTCYEAPVKILWWKSYELGYPVVNGMTLEAAKWLMKIHSLTLHYEINQRSVKPSQMLGIR